MNGVEFQASDVAVRLICEKVNRIKSVTVTLPATSQGKSLGSAQRGVAFSTVAAFLVSELILIVGAGYHDQLKGQDFDIALLGQFIEPYVGEAGVIVFAIGFIAGMVTDT